MEPPATDPFTVGDVTDNIDTLKLKDAEDEAYPRPLTKPDRVWNPATRPEQATVAPVFITADAVHGTPSAKMLNSPLFKWLPLILSVTIPLDEIPYTDALVSVGVRLTNW